MCEQIVDGPFNGSGLMQSKLLRAIQEQETERFGRTQTLQIDVRFAVATNRDLNRMVDEGNLRNDLYHRCMPSR